MSHPISRQSPSRGAASSSPFRSGTGGRSRGTAVNEAIVPEKTILKRFPANAPSVDVPVGVGLWPRNQESLLLQDMQRRREEAYMLLAAATRNTNTVTVTSSLICKECNAAKQEGRPAEFHPCVFDQVVVGFRTTAGPIQRPSKKHGRP